MGRRIRLSEAAKVMWQYQNPGGKKYTGAWQDMPDSIAQALETEYMRQFNDGGMWAPWDYTLAVSEELTVALTFNFGSMTQWSHTHSVKRRIRRILVTDA